MSRPCKFSSKRDTAIYILNFSAVIYERTVTRISMKLLPFCRSYSVQKCFWWMEIIEICLYCYFLEEGLKYRPSRNNEYLKVHEIKKKRPIILLLPFASNADTIVSLRLFAFLSSFLTKRTICGFSLDKNGQSVDKILFFRSQF